MLRSGETRKFADRRVQDSDEVDDYLREAGIDEEVLWDLFYNHTTTLEEVINEFRNVLQPPLIDAYAQYFYDTAHSAAS